VNTAIIAYLILQLIDIEEGFGKSLLTQVAGYEKEDKTEYRNQKIDKPRIPKSKESLYLLGLLRKRKIQF